MSRGRALSLAKPGSGSGLKDAKQQNAAIRIADRMQKRAGKMARKGEGDRHIPVRCVVDACTAWPSPLRRRALF